MDNDKNILPAHGCHENACKRVVVQKADVSVPIEIRPSAVVGRITSECMGEPRITNESHPECCHVTITQTICVIIPIEYNVTSRVEDSEVSCHTASAQ
jgi:hypothetical protein